MAAPNANCTVRFVKNLIIAPYAISFFCRYVLQMAYDLSEQSDFRLKPIHAPIKTDIGRDRFCACMKCEADLVAVLPPHLGVRTLPL
jgi:hypothetical protein